MPCNVNRNSQGVPYQVRLENGTPSVFFKELVSQPHLEADQALDLYKSTQLDSQGKYQEIEHQVVYQDAKGKTYEKMPFDKGVIQIGFSQDGSFRTLASVDTRQDKSSTAGFVNFAIHQKFVASERILVDNEWKLQGYGASMAEKGANITLLQQRANDSLGYGTVKNNGDGSFTITPINEDYSFTDSKGETQSISRDAIVDAINNGRYDELIRRNPAINELIPSVFYQELVNRSNPQSFVQPTDKQARDLRLTLMRGLETMGIEAMTMVDYIDRYNQRNGTDPNINALADIGNQVVAFARGQDTVENLSEETAHFIIEGADQNVVDTLLKLVEQTREYQEFVDQYRTKYGAKFSGRKLDDMVRREILGKVLANKIIQRFQNQQNEQLHTGLRGIWNRFVTKIRSLFTPAVSEQLDTVLDEMADAVLDGKVESIINTSQFDGKPVFYALNKQDKNTLVLLEKTRNRLNNLLAKKRASKSADTESIRDLRDSIENAGGEKVDTEGKWTALRGFVTGIELQNKQIRSQVLELEENLRYNEANPTKKPKPTYLTQEQQAVVRDLTLNFIPILREIRALSERLPSSMKHHKKQMLPLTDSAISDLEIIAGKISTLYGDTVDNHFEEVGEATDASEEQIKRWKEQSLQNNSDTSLLQQWFGGLQHAGSGVLNALGKIIWDNNSRANHDAINRITPFIQRIAKNGFKIKDFERITKKIEGKLTRYLLNPINFAQFEKDVLNARYELYKKTYKDKEGYKELTIEQFVEAGKRDGLLNPTTAELTLAEQQKYEEGLDDISTKYEERRFTQDYYDKVRKERKLISPKTVRYLKTLSRRKAALLNPYTKKGQQLDLTKLPASVLYQLQALAHERKAAKSLFDARSGKRKEGDALQLANELETLDNYRNEERKKSGEEAKFKKDFLDAIRKLENTQGHEAAFEFMMTNSGLVFNENFWTDIQTGGESFIESLRKDNKMRYEDSDKDKFDANEIDIAALAELVESRKAILKQYQRSNSPSEINYGLMERSVRQRIISVETEIQQLQRKLRLSINPVREKALQDRVISENTTNEAYDAELQASDLTELEFILEHVTKEDYANILKLHNSLAKVQQGQLVHDKRAEFFLRQVFNDPSLRLNNAAKRLQGQDIDAMAVQYAKGRIMPYFKRFAPASYQNYLEHLKTQNGSVSELVSYIQTRGTANETVRPKGFNQVEQYLDLSTNYAWLEQDKTDQYKNPNYDENFKGGYRQPKIDKYLDDAYFNHYGINKDTWKAAKDKESVVATKNKEDFDQYRAQVDFMAEIVENYQETGAANLYQIPQIGARGFQKKGRFFSKNTANAIRDGIRDVIMNRVDDPIYGDPLTEGTDIRIIPKYYMNPLEDPTTVSTEYGYSYAMMMRASLDYKYRNDTIGKVNALQQRLADSQIAGKDGKDSRTMQMFNNFKDAYFFGIQQTANMKVNIFGKELDLAPVLRSFDRYVRGVNIAYSLPVAITGAITGQVFYSIESRMQQYIPRKSANWAGKELSSLLPDYMKETGELNKDNKLHLMGEKFQVFDLLERTQSSGYSKVLRALNDPKSILGKISNFPLAPRIMLGILDDYRLVGDRFINFNQYRKLAENQGVKREDLERQWNNQYREKSMYNSMEVVDGIMRFKPDVETTVGKERLQRTFEKVRTKITSVNSNIDSIIPMEDKSSASRHVVASFMMAHRGWLTNNLQRKFKDRHYNIATGMEEEGIYRTLFRFVKKFATHFSAQWAGKASTTIREEWDTLEDFEKQNLRRILGELTAFGALIAFGVAVAKWADDEENQEDFLTQFTAYMYFRTASEVGSTQLIGVGQLVDTVNDPFIVAGSFKDIYSTLNPANLFDTVERGTYEGLPKTARHLIKQTHARHIMDLNGIREKSNYYRLLNKEVLPWIHDRSLFKEENE